MKTIALIMFLLAGCAHYPANEINRSLSDLSKMNDILQSGQTVDPKVVNSAPESRPEKPSENTIEPATQTQQKCVKPSTDGGKSCQTIIKLWD